MRYLRGLRDEQVGSGSLDTGWGHVGRRRQGRDYRCPASLQCQYGRVMMENIITHRRRQRIDVGSRVGYACTCGQVGTELDIRTFDEALKSEREKMKAR